MNKIINILLISFFSCLTINKEILLFLYIPVLMFYSSFNSKNLIILVVLGLISTYFFNNAFFLLFIVIICLYLFYYVMVKKIYNKYDNIYMQSIMIIILNSVSLVMKYNTLNQKMIILYIVLLINNIIINYFINYNLQKSLSIKNNIYSFFNIEVIMFIITILGSIKIDNTYNISFLLSSFFIMYLSSSQALYHSLFFSFSCASFFMFFLKLNYAFILPFISALYMLNGLWGAIILISSCFIIWISKQKTISEGILQNLIYTAVFFEIFKTSFIPQTIKEEEIYKDAYKKSIKGVNDNIINFASFLDCYNKDYIDKKENIKKIEKAVNDLKRTYCDMCYLKDICIKNNKNILNQYFYELLIYSKRSDYSNDTFVHLKKCPYSYEMKNMAIELNKRYNLNISNTKTNMLVGIINGLSNILKIYTIDNVLKKEISYKTLYNIKKGLMNHGYNITYLSPIKMFVNDFEIEVGLRGESYYEVKNNIETICNNYFSCSVSSIFKHNEKGKLYLSIIPKIKYSIDFGYCNFASNESNVSGDNCLIKEVGNTKNIAVICDGMGKGYEANYLSFNIIKLIDKIASCNMSCDSSIQILNTFYYLEEYMEKYSTLDYLEIDKISGVATLFKLGGAASYIINEKGSCEIIENQSLPLGMEEAVEGIKIELKNNDVIVMASDGVFDSSVRKEEIESYMKGLIHLPAQKIVYEIAKTIKSGERIDDDDMTIIVMKLNKI